MSASSLQEQSDLPLEKIKRNATKRPKMYELDHHALLWSIERLFKDRIDGSFVEIGVLKANSAMCILKAMDILGINQTLYSVDHVLKTEAREHWTQKIPIRWPDRSVFVETDCNHVARESLPEKIAWIFVDGCHCEDCVKKDIEHYVSRLVVGGIAAFHDTSIRARKRTRAFTCFNAYQLGGCNEMSPARNGVNKAIEESDLVRDYFSLIAEVDGTVTRGDKGTGGMKIYQRVR